MSIRTGDAPKVNTPAPPNVARMSIGAWASENMGKGKLVTKLVGGRGQPDLLKNPGELAKHQIGTFEKPGRGGPRTFNVYSVALPGKDDKLQNHVIVRAPVVQPNDTIVYKYFDLGVMPMPKPNQ